MPTETPGNTLLKVNEGGKSILPATSLSGVWGKLFSFPMVLACSLTYLAFLLSKRGLTDPDLWWHMRNAQYLLTNGHLPVVDNYSFTAPGATVFPFEWLAEIPYYLAFKGGGFPAVFILVFILATAIILGIFRLSYIASDDVKNSFVVSIAGALLAGVSIGARTLMFGWLYLVILLLILEAARRGNWKWLWLVPPLFCLWVNTHGSWPMGIVVFGIFIASGLIEGNWGQAYATRWSGHQLKRLLITAGASAAALFVNPLGYRLVFFPFQVMYGPGSHGLKYIEEFASVNFHTAWGKTGIVLILGALLIAVFSRERWRLDEVAFMMLALYFSLTYIRFMFLAAILVCPIFAKRVKLMTPYDRSSDKWLYNALALAILLGVFIVSVPQRSKLQSLDQYPNGAIAYMKSNGIHGRVFNDYVWGGYLIWHMPELKVFIDGRFCHYAVSGVFDDYLSAFSNDNPQAVFDKYQVEYVLMPPESLLTRSLKSSSTWTVRYSDKTSVLLQRTPTSQSSQ